MKKAILTLLICLMSSFSFAVCIFSESFEFANHDMTIPIGWNCPDESWLCGYMDKDHNRTAHTGNWYAFTNADDSWMFMQQFIGSQLRYNISYWAISDGTYNVEFWAGNGPDPSQMAQLLFSATVSTGEYEQFADYIETITGDYQYFGIHATAAEGAYHLTIDDIYIDMVNKYDLEVTPYVFDTTLNPGTTITIEFDMQNKGYEDLYVYMTPLTESFTDVSFTADGNNTASFPTVPQQNVHCTCTSTLLPTVEPGSRVWLDIMITVSCDCLERMVTLWVNVPNPEEVEEHKATVKLYPNPAKGHVNIEGTGWLTVTNSLGQTVMTRWIDEKESLDLPKGIYIVRLENDGDVNVEKVVVE